MTLILPAAARPNRPLKVPAIRTGNHLPVPRRCAPSICVRFTPPPNPLAKSPLGPLLPRTPSLDRLVNHDSKHCDYCPRHCPVLPPLPCAPSVPFCARATSRVQRFHACAALSARATDWRAPLCVACAQIPRGHCSCTRNVLARTQTVTCESCSVRCSPVTCRPGRICLVRCSWVRPVPVQAGPLWADSSRAGLTGSAGLVASLGHKSQNICLYHLLLSIPRDPRSGPEIFSFQKRFSFITDGGLKSPHKIFW